MRKKLIELKNVTFTYEADEEGLPGYTAVKDVSLDVYEGEFLAVLGHNGSGKSTMAKMMNAVFEPTQGTVTVDGIVADSEEKGDEIRRIVGMVFQNPDNQIVATIVEDDVAFGPENLGVEPSEIRRRVDDALKTVGMYELREREPHKLSGGQKQRVAIAGVLAMQTRGIILDEPTAMLDPTGREEVLKTVIRLNREMGITVVLITHFMDEAVQADRVAVMDGGKIIAEGTPREIFAREEFLREHSLDIPQSTELCRRLGFEECILTPDECADKISSVLGGAAL